MEDALEGGCLLPVWLYPFMDIHMYSEVAATLGCVTTHIAKKQFQLLFRLRFLFEDITRQHNLPMETVLMM